VGGYHRPRGLSVTQHGPGGERGNRCRPPHPGKLRIPCFGSLAPLGHTHRLLVTSHTLVKGPLPVLSSPFESLHSPVQGTPLTSMENRSYARSRNDASDGVPHGLK
jgi:hypothetical protein